MMISLFCGSTLTIHTRKKNHSEALFALYRYANCECAVSVYANGDRLKLFRKCCFCSFANASERVELAPFNKLTSFDLYLLY